MNITLTFKNFEPSDHLRAYANRRFQKLGRFVHKSENVEVTAVLAVDKFRHKADVQFVGDAMNISAVEQSADMYATVDMVLDKLEVQLKKHAERMKEKRRSGADRSPGHEAASDFEESRGAQMIIEEERVEAKPMYTEEAAMQLEQKNDNVLVFLNADTSRVNVLYRRKQGGFGLIDPEM